MTDPHADTALEAQIDQWRSYLRRRQAIHAVDVAERNSNGGVIAPRIFRRLPAYRTDEARQPACR